MKYRHLFFDLDNTLWDYNTNSYHALKRVLSQLNLLDKTENYDDFFKMFSKINEQYRKLLRERKINKKSYLTERFEAAFEINGTPLPGIGDMVNDGFMREISEMKMLKEGALETMEYLHSRHNLYIITNGFKDTQHRKLYNSGISRYFKRVFTSEEIGASKPDRKIFEHAIKSSNAKKCESIMIGDSMDIDIIGAKKFGIDQILITGKKPNFFITPPKTNPSDRNKIKIQTGTPQQEHNIKQIKNTKTTTYVINSLYSLIDIF